jgi:hypothetical protein
LVVAAGAEDPVPPLEPEPVEPDPEPLVVVEPPAAVPELALLELVAAVLAAASEPPQPASTSSTTSATTPCPRIFQTPIFSISLLAMQFNLRFSQAKHCDAAKAIATARSASRRSRSPLARCNQKTSEREFTCLAAAVSAASVDREIRACANCRLGTTPFIPLFLQ